MAWRQGWWRGGVPNGASKRRERSEQPAECGDAVLGVVAGNAHAHLVHSAQNCGPFGYGPVDAQTHLDDSPLQEPIPDTCPSQAFHQVMQPPPLHVHSQWTQFWDEHSGAAYYYDAVSGQTTWVPPPQYAPLHFVVIPPSASPGPAPDVNPRSQQHVSGAEQNDSDADIDTDGGDSFEDGSCYDEECKLSGERCWGRPARVRNQDCETEQGLIRRRNRFKSISSIDSKSLEVIARFAQERRSYSSSKLVHHARRQRSNTLSSLKKTKSIADFDATEELQCVAAVIHAHMAQFLLAGARESHEQYDVFKEKPRMALAPPLFPEPLAWDSSRRSARLPTREAIFSFLQDVFVKAQMEKECILMSFVYLERLLKATRGGLTLNELNWKGVVLSTMILASKVWDDLSMWNSDFSKICPEFPLQRINQLEICLLEAVKYEVRIMGSQYAKYYFQLQSMRKALGIPIEAQDDNRSPVSRKQTPRRRCNTFLGS